MVAFNVFEQNLRAMIQGLRSHPDNEETYIASCLQDIRTEMTSSNINEKSNAITKLWYLQMLGHDISWASFAIVEVMSSPNFVIKRPAYFACCASFTEHTDVSLLVTNLFKKDFASKEIFHTTMALSCLASMGTPELCGDLHNDITSLVTSSRPYVRKKAVLCLYKVYIQCPLALRQSFGRLRERLEDEDQGVLTAAVNTMLELSRRNPQSFLSLVPHLYHLLTNTQNNWLIIKLMRFFGVICPAEPKLTIKLVEPLLGFLKSTRAKSVEFEAMKLVIEHLPPSSMVMDVALEHLQGFVDSCDKNLRYLGLQLLSHATQQEELYPKVCRVFPELHQKVLVFVEDPDESVRRVALHMLERIASPQTFQDIADKLLAFSRQASSGADEFTFTLLRLGELDDYRLVLDAAWYLVVLSDVACHHGNAKNSSIIARQFVYTTARLPSIRGFAVQLCCFLVAPAEESSSVQEAQRRDSMTARGEAGNKKDGKDEMPAPFSSDTFDCFDVMDLNNDRQLEDARAVTKENSERPEGKTLYTSSAPAASDELRNLGSSATNNVNTSTRRTSLSFVSSLVVGAAAFILGEYHESCPELLQGDQVLTSPFSSLRSSLYDVCRRVLTQALDSDNSACVQQACLWAVLKLFIGAAGHLAQEICSPSSTETLAILQRIRTLFLERLPRFFLSPHVEVSDRASFALAFLKYFPLSDMEDLHRVKDSTAILRPPLVCPPPHDPSSLPVPPEDLDVPFDPSSLTQSKRKPLMASEPAEKSFTPGEDTAASPRAPRDVPAVPRRHSALMNSSSTSLPTTTPTTTTTTSVRRSAPEPMSEMERYQSRLWQTLVEDSTLRVYYCVHSRDPHTAPDAPLRVRVDVRCEVRNPSPTFEIGAVYLRSSSVSSGLWKAKGNVEGNDFVLLSSRLVGKSERATMKFDCQEWMVPTDQKICGEIRYSIVLKDTDAGSTPSRTENKLSPFTLTVPSLRSLEPIPLENEDEVATLLNSVGPSLHHRHIEFRTYSVQAVGGNDDWTSAISIMTAKVKIICKLCNLHCFVQHSSATSLSTEGGSNSVCLKCFLLGRVFNPDFETSRAFSKVGSKKESQKDDTCLQIALSTSPSALVMVLFTVSQICKSEEQPREENEKTSDGHFVSSESSSLRVKINVRSVSNDASVSVGTWISYYLDECIGGRLDDVGRDSE